MLLINCYSEIIIIIICYYYNHYYHYFGLAFLLYSTHFIQTLYLKNNKWLPDSINLRLFSGNLYLLSLQIVKCKLICNKGMNKVVVVVHFFQCINLCVCPSVCLCVSVWMYACMYVCVCVCVLCVWCVQCVWVNERVFWCVCITYKVNDITKTIFLKFFIFIDCLEQVNLIWKKKKFFSAYWTTEIWAIDLKFSPY